MSIFRRFFAAQALADILQLEEDLAEERVRSAKLAAKLDVMKTRCEELSMLNEDLRQGIRANVAANVNLARAYGAPDHQPDPLPDGRGKAWRLEEKRA